MKPSRNNWSTLVTSRKSSVQNSEWRIGWIGWWVQFKFHLFVSKFIILTFIDKLFFYFAYYGRQQWFLAVPVGFSRQNFSRSKWSPYLTCVQITFVSKFINLTFIYKLFFHFAYCDRKQWFLVGTGGFSHLFFFRS